MNLFGWSEVKQLQKAIKKNPNDISLILKLGWLYLDEGGYSEAQEQFSNAQDMGASSSARAQARLGLAIIDIKNGKTDTAKEILESVLQEPTDFPRKADAHFYLGTIYEEQLRENKNTLEQGSEIRNQGSEISSQKPGIRSAKPEAGGKKQVADSKLQTPGSRLQVSGSALLEKTIQEYKTAITQQAQETNRARYLLGKLLFDYGQGERALGYLETALRQEKLEKNPTAPLPRAEIFNILGALYKSVKNDPETAKNYHRSVLDQTSNPTLQASSCKRLGDIYREQNAFALALDHYQRAAKYYGNSSSQEALEIQISLAEMYLQEGNLRKAVEGGEQVIASGTASKDLLKRAYPLLAKGYKGFESYEKAVGFQKLHVDSIRAPKEYSIIAPTEKIEALAELGYFYEKLGQYDEAIDTYKAALKLDPGGQFAADMHLALGRIHLLEEKLSSAIKQLEEAVDLQTVEEKKAEASRLLGECYLKRGDTEKGIEILGRVVTRYKDSIAANEAKRALKDLKREITQEVKQEKRDVEEADRLKEIVDEVLDEKSLFERLKQGLAKTHQNFIKNLETLLTGRTKIDGDLLEQLEEILILADLGVDTTLKVISSIQDKVKKKELQDPAQLRAHLKREILSILKNGETALDVTRAKPFVIMIIGVNGTGKTTTIGKLAHGFKSTGKDVLLIAGDTFRAAAIEQLEIWGQRAGCDVIKHEAGADPSAVIYDGMQAAKSRNVDVVIVDTAGRLHTKKNLMDELKKMKRVASRELPGSPHEVFLILDATTGQNAISQAKLFNEEIGITGLILTKLDGTAKGGIITGIVNELKIPVTYIGVGEKIFDLRPFKAEEFVEALFSD